MSALPHVREDKTIDVFKFIQLFNRSATLFYDEGTHGFHRSGIDERKLRSAIAHDQICVVVRRPHPWFV